MKPLRPELRKSPPLRLPILLLILMISGLAATAQERFRKSPPFPGPRPELALPSLEFRNLSNGLTVAVAPMRESPLALVQLIISAGVAHSPENLPALAVITARMMRRGTRNISAEAMLNRIEELGGSFSISVQMEYTVFEFQVLKEDVNSALRLLRSMILESTFPSREIDSLKRELVYEIRSRARNPEFLGRRQFLRLLFEGHPYGKAGYNEKTIRLTTEKDIEAFYRKYYLPNNAVCVTAGDINLSEAVLKVSGALGTWRPGELEPMVPPPVQPNNKERLCLVDLPGDAPPAVFVGNLTTPLTKEDFFPFLVLNHILGGTTSSRLFMNLRESKGWAFDAFSDFEIYKSSGIYWAKARVTPENLSTSIAEMAREIRSLAASRIAPAEIEEAKSYLIGNLPLQFEAPTSFAARIARMTALDLGDAHWTRAAENLMRVNAPRVSEVARKCFLSVPLVVVVGPREPLLKILSSDFASLELYDQSGVHVETIRQGEIK